MSIINKISSMSVSAVVQKAQDEWFKKYAPCAREKFPDMTDDTIRRNLPEIAYVKDAEELCATMCLSIEMCPVKTAGYKPVMCLTSNGCIMIEMQPCQYNKGEL